MSLVVPKGGSQVMAIINRIENMKKPLETPLENPLEVRDHPNGAL